MKPQLSLHALEKVCGYKVRYMRALGAYDPRSEGAQWPVVAFPYRCLVSVSFCALIIDAPQAS